MPFEPDGPLQRSGSGREIDVVVHNFQMPEKYQPRSVDLLVRQLPGYPEMGMDMFWTRPDVVLVSTGRKPEATECTEHYGDLPWQRWSRHMGVWRPGRDNLETFFAALIRELNK